MNLQSVHLFLFTLRWGQIIWEVSWACSSIHVGVHKLAMVLSLANCISDTIKRLCGGAGGTLLEMFRCLRLIISKKAQNWGGEKSKHSTDVPLRPSPMKILYRRELHRTTPTNFLYHVRFTYWLPVQLLCTELYLKVNGIQIGSPPEEQRSNM